MARKARIKNGENAVIRKRRITLIVISILVIFFVVWMTQGEKIISKDGLFAYIIAIGFVSMTIATPISIVIGVLYFRREKNLDSIIMNKFRWLDPSAIPIKNTGTLGVYDINERVVGFISDREQPSSDFDAITANEKNSKIAIACIEAQLNEIKIRRENLTRSIALSTFGLTSLGVLFKFININISIKSFELFIVFMILLSFMYIAICIDEYIYNTRKDRLTIKALTILKGYFQTMIEDKSIMGDK